MPEDAGPETAPFVIKNVEHTELARQLADGFGNAPFAPLQPGDEMLSLVGHHDDGWQPIDDDPPLDPASGLPFNLIQTPFDYLLQAGSASPSRNEARSPLSGLLSSMHTCGLYNGRYGLSDKMNIDLIPEHQRPAVEAMLRGEEQRQIRLRRALRDNPWAAEDKLLRNYKLLQFFDTCALYFNVNAAGLRAASVFHHVPDRDDRDVSITVTELEPGVYRFRPYPFTATDMEVYCEGRYLRPRPDVNDGAALMASQPLQRQVYRLVQ